MSRYLVECVLTAALEALADKRGRPSRDESPLDYCEADDAERVIEAASFEDAVRTARDWLQFDYFGQVRIERVVQVRSRFGDRLAAEAVWHLTDEAEELDEAKPEHCPEIDLVDDERIET